MYIRKNKFAYSAAITAGGAFMVQDVDIATVMLLLSILLLSIQIIIDDNKKD